VFAVSSNRKEVKKVDVKMEDMSLILAEVSGSWVEKLIIGNEEIWNINRDKPVWHLPVKTPLPSDSRYREDLVWLKHGNSSYAEEWKVKLEQVLDKEEALRAKTKK